MANTFRKGLGVIVGAAAGVGHFLLNNVFKEWYKIAIGLFIASFFFNPITALTIAAGSLGLLLAYKTILSFSQNVDSTDGKVVEHTPVANAMLYGCGITNKVAGPKSVVYSVRDRQVVAYGNSSRLQKEPVMQRIIDNFDGIAFSSKYKL